MFNWKLKQNMAKIKRNSLDYNKVKEIYGKRHHGLFFRLHLPKEEKLASNNGFLL